MTIKENKKVVIGGTFESLHKGHRFFLEKSFNLGKVFIGLTSDQMARKTKKREVQIFEERKKELEKFIKTNFDFNYEIGKIEDKFGPTLQKDFDFIVVSPETKKTAFLINKEREKINKKPIGIVEIKFILAEDGKPISSTRILKGEIDKEGKALKK